MIRGIVAIDQKRGMARADGIPWQLPREAKYFVDHIASAPILMGHGTYLEVAKPFHGGPDYVATGSDQSLREGFISVVDAREFLRDFEGDIWNIGGPGLLASTLDLLDELYVTQIDADFECTKFLPEYKDMFHLVSHSETQHEKGVRYRFEVWQHN